MKQAKRTAVVVIGDRVSDIKIQCVATDEEYKGSKVWVDPKTEKKYYIVRFMRKYVFCEVDK